MFPWCYLFCIVKKNLLCVVLRVDISEQHSAGGATKIASSIDEGLKEILLLRVYPSRFPGIPNRATRPITIVCSLLRVHPGGAGCPAPKPPAGLTPPARGGGCYILPVTARSKMKIKRFWFYTIFFHMRPHITSGPEPFNCAR